MGPSFNGDFSDFGYGAMPDVDFGAVGLVLGILLVFYFIMIGYCILVYVLNSLGMYTMAKRRGIHNPWLAWVPVGNIWVLGSISDQYQYVAKGQVRNRRKTLLGLTIATYALMIPYMAGAFMMGFGAAMNQEMGLMTGGTVLLVVCFLAMMVVAIIHTVFVYIAYYDLFQSAKPNWSVAFLVLSIFFNFLPPFFVFACRKHDEGMPPRRDVYTRPVQPVQPVLPVVEAAPVMDPAEPVAEETDFAEPAEEETEA